MWRFIPASSFFVFVQCLKQHEAFKTFYVRWWRVWLFCFLFVLFILTLDFFRIKELQQKELINSFHLTQFWPKCHFRHCFPGRICRIWVYCVHGNQFRHLQTLKLRPDSAQLQLQYVSVNESGNEWWVTEAVSELCVSTADFWANYFWNFFHFYKSADRS